MVDEQPLLEMLSVVGEVQAEKFGVASGAVVLGGGGDAHQVAAEPDGEVPQHGVTPEADMVRRDMHGVIGPVLDRDDPQLRAVAENELDVLRVGAAALLIEHDSGLRERAESDLQVPEGTWSSPGPVTVIVTGSATSASRPTVTTVAASNDEYACAATRSNGTPPWPNRVSPRPTVSTCTPSTSLTSMVAVPSAIAVPSCSPRSRRSGVNRHASSRPPGISKAFTSNDVNTSPLLTAGARFSPRTASWTPLRATGSPAVLTAGSPAVGMFFASAVI